MNRTRDKALKELQEVGLRIFDLHLFLNTHPENIHALRQYEYFQNRHEELTREYERIYGPLTRKIVPGTDRWSWLDGPWPWENEYNLED